MHAAQGGTVHVVVEDASLQALTYRRLLRAADALSAQWRSWSGAGSAPLSTR